MVKLDAERKKHLEGIIEDFIVGENSSDAKTLAKVLEMVDDENVLYRIVKSIDKTLVGSNVVKRIKSEEMLERIALDSEIDSFVRITAIRGIRNQNVLKKLYESTCDSIRKAVVFLITDEKFLYDLVFNEKSHHVGIAAIGRIATQEYLYNIAVRHKVVEVQIAAVVQIKEQKWLAKIAKLSCLNAKIREEAIKKLNPHELEAILLDIAKNDIEITCRIEAIKCLITPKFLLDIALSDSNVEVQYVALSAITEISIFSEVNKGLISIVNGDYSYKVKAMAVEKIAISSDEFFVELMKKESDEELRLAAVRRIDNQTHLANIAYYEATKYQYQSTIRMEALKRLKALDVINMIAMSDRDSKIRKIAIERAYPATLVNIAINDAETDVAIAAIEKLENDYELIEVLLNTKDRWVRNAVIIKLCSNMKK